MIKIHKTFKNCEVKNIEPNANLHINQLKLL